MKWHRQQQGMGLSEQKGVCEIQILSSSSTLTPVWRPRITWLRCPVLCCSLQRGLENWDEYSKTAKNEWKAGENLLQHEILNPQSIYAIAKERAAYPEYRTPEEANSTKESFKTQI